MDINIPICYSDITNNVPMYNQYFFILDSARSNRCIIFVALLKETK